MVQQFAPKTSVFRRHPIMTAMALLAAACLAGASIFLATFDLNAYRETLASRLSAALEQPVTIGSASMSWRKGPAFDISAIRIGDPLEEPIGEIAHLFLQPRLLPLLRGKIVFDEMILDHPRYKLCLPAPDSATEIERPPALLTALLQTVQVRNLTVVDGQLDLDNRRAVGPSAQMQVRAIELKIHNLLTGRPGKLQLSAKLLQNQDVATLSVKGHVVLGPDMRDWRQNRGTLELQLENIATEQLFAWFPKPSGSPELKGKGTLTLSTEGSAVDGLHFTARLTGENLTLAWPGRYHKAPSIKTFAVSGIWTDSESLGRLTDLDLQLDKLSLHGHLSLQHNQDQPWLEGTLNSAPLALPEIRGWLPDRIRLSETKLLHTSLEQGTVQIHHLRFAGPLQDFLQADTSPPINDVRIALSNARLPLLAAAPLEQVNASLTLQDGDLHVTNGTAQLMKSPVRFFGKAKNILQADQDFSFNAEWDAPASPLSNGLKTARMWKGKANGIIPVTVSLTGSPGQMRGNLQANLARCGLDWPGILSKPVGSPAELRLSGYQQNDSLIVEGGRLSLSPFDLQFSGKIGLAEKLPLDLRLKLPRTDLTKAAQLFPALATYRAAGALSLNGQLSGGVAKPAFTGQLRLDAGALGVKILAAELRDINGTIDISNQQCRFTGIQARLGQSAVTLDGELAGATERAFTLHFKAPRIGAGELIFPGSKVVFRNLDGSITVSRNGIRYENILFDLGTGQGFKLDGSQGFTDPVIAELVIHAKESSIDEVLALWEDEPPAEAEEENTHHRLVIQATVDEGYYGHLSFSQAKGTVVAENNTVIISPLSFRTGSGSCQGKVIVDNNDDRQSILTISGQLAGVDAAHLHSELLQKKGLVTGNLSGQVQLQGPAGPELLTRGTGQATIHIQDGVLRKFSFLSKVFSLLNVAQVFTLHLPDMASHGMPFTALDGSFSLSQGVLTTEDLAVASNAMNLSLVGNFDLKQDQLDLLMGVKPFGTIDKIVSKIPLAGWILTGENKALITAHFRIQGSGEEPEVEAIPITSVSEKVFGIFQRVLGLPGKVVTDVGNLFESEAIPPAQTEPPAMSTPDQQAESGRTPQ